MKFKVLLPLFLACVCVLSCKKKKKEDEIVPALPMEAEMGEEDVKINDFIWSSMNSMYLWMDKVSALSDTRFANQNEKRQYFKGFRDHKEFFNTLLYQKDVVDRWSFITDDYVKWENQLNGVTTSMGYEFTLYRYGTNSIFGIVEYVVKSSPAAKAGIQRGEIFTKINGQSLTTNNYQKLLETSYHVLGLATISGNTIYESTITKKVTAEVIHENPIFLDTMYTYSGRKVGYLIYNAFVKEYDNALSQVFVKFKAQGIDHLILDLRYNGGGYQRSAQNLASMIYTTDTSKLFMQMVENQKNYEYDLKKYGEEYFKVKFANTTADDSTGVPIQSLNLTSLYVITSPSTASSSELIINGLKPYMNVVLVGGTTQGKNVGSVTIKDYDTLGNLNPNHKWALQPIVVKAANSVGFSDYEKGFEPNHKMEQPIGSYSPLGDTRESLLAMALSLSTGLGATTLQARTAESEFSSMGFSKDFQTNKGAFYLGERRLGKKK